MSEEQINTQINTLKRKRGSVKSKLTHFTNYLNLIELKYSDPIIDILENDILNLESRYNQVLTLNEEFDKYQSELEEIVSSDTIDTYYSEREQFWETFHNQLARGKAMLLKFNPSSSNSNSNISNNQHLVNESVNLQYFKLPPIEVPKFDGNYDSWLEFKETFTSLVHTNKSLRNFQKFHYLKASLVGGAAQVIASVEFSEENYLTSWKLLCERYDNTRLLVHNHVKALFSLEVKGFESSKALRFVIDSLNKHLKALKQLNQPTEYWDTLVIHIITSKLNSVTAREWEQYRADKNIPTLEHLKTFLKSKADLLETLESKQVLPHSNFQHQGNKVTNKSKSFMSSEGINASNNYTKCAFCKKDHFIRNCAEFLKLSAEDRNINAKKLRLCLNCLRYGHFNSVCRFSNCRQCNGRHNTLLHVSANEIKVKDEIGNTYTGEKEVSLTNFNTSYESVLLATAFVQVVGKNNRTYTVRALLDSASQSSFVTSDLCDKLDLKTENVNMSVLGLNNASSKVTKKCEIFIQSVHNAFSTKFSCLVIDKITGMQPAVPVNTDFLNIPKNIILADPEFCNPGKIDMLIGANLFWQLLLTGQIHLGPNQPILQKTVLGWIISGCISVQSKNTVNCNLSFNCEVQAQLAKFWELEECSVKIPYSTEEKLCEKHFVHNTKRDLPTGKFIVSMPFKKDLTELGDSEAMAKKRFFSLERKLNANADFRERYVNFLDEYKLLGHMKKVEKPDNAKFCYYMPHHGVIREESTTTKLRVVFDASAATSNGVSLNDIQMIGPTIQNSLFNILLRFRLHAFVITADIEKMYRQVLINPEQRSLQRILWRDNPNNELDVYELNTVTYGTASAPFLAIRCLAQLAMDYRSIYPNECKIIENDMYVDDLLTGANTVEDTIHISLTLSKIMSNGSFNLRKWHSNNREVLQAMQSTVGLENTVELGFDQKTKTLGLQWSCDSDTFLFSILLNSSEGLITKRVILSCIGQIFDPLGLLGPCVIVAKILLQKLWLERINWDDEIPINLQSAWNEFINKFKTLNNLKIPRHVLCLNLKSVELHGFSDSSEQAYGACVYLRTTDINNRVFVKLFCAKSKVTPLKIITIPKLELCAAALLTKLVKVVENAVSISFTSMTLWTDSTIVLGWLKTEPHLLKTFTANRVAEIQESTGHCNWRHVPTKDNPADLLSRGISPSEIQACDLWWHGPQWLSYDKSTWPQTSTVLNKLPELKPTKSFLVKCEESIIDLGRFSSFNKLLRTVAFVLRFKNIILKRKYETGILKVFELQNAYTFLLRLAQKDMFFDEIESLNNKKEIDSKSKILNLNPFLDNECILRVGGRLSNSDFSYDKKYPIIISAKHQLCKLIFEFEHLKLLHAGPQLLLSSIRETLWPVSGRNLAKATVRRCIRCFRFNPKFTSPIMGNLPKSRLDADFPFKVCGVDYAGPFMIKDRKGRGCKVSKCYISLFVCFTTKAVHIELVSDLSTDTFLLSLKRFIARRGKPTKIYSDNGSNFLGANAELKDLGRFLNDNQHNISETCASNSIEWHFIPAYSPHFGGIWEAGIKSCKYHLKRVIANNTLTFEELTTVLAQIEAVLNSRPITPLSTDPNDMNPLTPGHFLVGRPLTATAEPDVCELPIGRLSRFQMIEQMRQNFWRRWSKEYVSELQQRVKWKKTQSRLEKGSMVLVKNDNLVPMHWKLGRIVDLHCGKDNVPRVASIKVADGVIRRAFSKICPLPIDNNFES